MAHDPILSMLLAERGCPYEAGSIDSVVWMIGFNAGLEKAKELVEAAVGQAKPTTVGDAPVVVQWRSSKPRRGRVN